MGKRPDQEFGTAGEAKTVSLKVIILQVMSLRKVTKADLQRAHPLAYFVAPSSPDHAQGIAFWRSSTI
jgi:hypothetical protein